MRLPFSKRAARVPNAIDVKATAVAPPEPHLRGVALVLPDLGDYAQQFPEPLPHGMRHLPAVTALLLLSFVGWWLAQDLQARRIQQDKVVATRRVQQAQDAAKRLHGDAAKLTDKQQDLEILRKWVRLHAGIRGMVVAVTSAAADKVQIRTLDIKRRDPNAIRFAVTMTCVGTRNGFDAMRKELSERLDREGWTLTETPPDPDDTRLILDGTVAPKK